LWHNYPITSSWIIIGKVTGIAMQTDISSMLQSIDSVTLTPVVRQSLQRANFRILDWRMSQLGGGAGNPVSVGLYRFEGTGQDGEEQMAWSVILKILQSPANAGWVNMGEGDDQSHWNYWKREVLIYQSGLLETLPDGLVAPRCFGTVELPGHIAMLWLEDIHDAYQGAWTLERYALTARHLGRLNGQYVSGRPLPDYPWFSLQRTRQWVNQMPHWQTIDWDHPRLLKRYPKAEQNSFRRMLSENERFLARLDLLPKTICHGDTYPTNFMARHLPNGQEQTVALDWALTSIEALGDDLGQFVFGAQSNLKTARQEDVTDTLFAAYMDGLRDSNCRVDPQQVRFGFAASAALRVGLFQVFLLGEELKNSQAVGADGIEYAAAPDCFEVRMANEAYQLIESK
jgi:hypothetical protein